MPETRIPEAGLAASGLPAQDSPASANRKDMPKAPSIPRFFLYGEPPEDVELDFLHVEQIRLRSGRHDWLIAPHAHPEHTQILLVQQNGGSIRIEGQYYPAQAPCLMLIPAGMVHAITFSPETDGVVATIANAYLRDLSRVEQGLLPLIRTPCSHALAADSASLSELSAAFEAMLREFVWQAPGRRAAIAAHLQRVLVELLRLSAQEAQAATTLARRNLDLAHRYRELIERHFRERHAVAFYAGQLHVTPARLNVACNDAAGKSATNLLFDRVVIEAKRHLHYTNLGVAEIAHVLGFSDAAYFTRFFTRRAGMAPSRFRDSAGAKRSAE
jgi:AraC family transcriptional regulator, transcriptional activator of pobA